MINDKWCALRTNEFKYEIAIFSDSTRSKVRNKKEEKGLTNESVSKSKKFFMDLKAKYFQ